MATLYITEFKGLGRDSEGHVTPFPAMPVVAQKTITVAGTAAACTAFSSATCLIRLTTDTACCVAVSPSITATTAMARLAVGSVEYFTVPPGQDYTVSTIAA